MVSVRSEMYCAHGFPDPADFQYNACQRHRSWAGLYPPVPIRNLIWAGSPLPRKFAIPTINGDAAQWLARSTAVAERAPSKPGQGGSAIEVNKCVEPLRFILESSNTDDLTPLLTLDPRATALPHCQRVTQVTVQYLRLRTAGSTV